MSAFATAAKKLQNSKFVIPVTLAVLVGVVIGCFAFYEDYISSLEGYKMLPTRKSGQEVVQVIALLPQVGQIIFFYMFGRTVTTINGKRKANPLYFTVAFFLLLFDLGTDMYFKASGLGFSVWIIALIESLTVFTIGSEILLTASLGIGLELAPEALSQLANIFGGWLPENENQNDRINQR